MKIKSSTRNGVARDLRTPKYRMRIVKSKKKYNRKKEKQYAIQQG